jgi:hypothetical protein
MDKIIEAVAVEVEPVAPFILTEIAELQLAFVGGGMGETVL